MAQDYFGAQLYGLRASIDRVIASYEAAQALPPLVPVRDPIQNDGIIQFPGVKNSHVLRPKEGELKVNLKGVSVCTTPRNDGRYQGYWVVDGERIYFYGKTVDDLKSKIAAAVRKGKPPKRKKTERKTYTLGEWLDEWAKLYKYPKLKVSSRRSLDEVIKQLKNAFGKKLVDKINAIELQKYFAVKPSRRYDMQFLYLNAALKKAQILKLIKDNPCAAVELPKYQTEKKPAMTRDEQRKFINACSESKYAPLFRFLLATGLRIGEALALTPEDFRDGSVYVSKNVIFQGSKRIEQITPKSDAGVRYVPVPSAAMPPMQTPLVFPYGYNQCRIALDKIAENAGVKTTLHGLRHTYATRLEEAGIPPKIKQRLMGHATLEMTQNVYTDVQSEYIDSYVDAIKKSFDTAFDTVKKD